MDRLKREWIRINEEATIMLIGKFLSQKLATEAQRREPGDFEVRAQFFSFCYNFQVCILILFFQIILSIVLRFIVATTAPLHY